MKSPKPLVISFTEFEAALLLGGKILAPHTPVTFGAEKEEELPTAVKDQWTAATKIRGICNLWHRNREHRDIYTLRAKEQKVYLINTITAGAKKGYDEVIKASLDDYERLLRAEYGDAKESLDAIFKFTSLLPTVKEAPKTDAENVVRAIAAILKNYKELTSG